MRDPIAFFLRTSRFPVSSSVDFSRLCSRWHISGKISVDGCLFGFSSDAVPCKSYEVLERHRIRSVREEFFSSLSDLIPAHAYALVSIHTLTAHCFAVCTYVVQRGYWYVGDTWSMPYVGPHEIPLGEYENRNLHFDGPCGPSPLLSNRKETN